MRLAHRLSRLAASRASFRLARLAWAAWAGAAIATSLPPVAGQDAATGIDAAATPASETSPAAVTIVTYNLKNYLPMERRVAGELVNGAPKPEEEVTAAVRLIASARPDIVGVCEIGDRSQVEDLQTRLKNSGFDLPHVEWVDAADEERHLALISRFPIVARNSQTELAYRIGDVQLPFQRGILDVTVEISPDYRLRLLGLHLKSKRDVPEADQAVMRRNEAYLVRRHVDAILAQFPETNLLLYGDLNDTRNEPPVREIQGPFGSPAYLRDIQVADADGYRWTYYWRYADIYSRFDFALASPGLYPEVLLDRSLIVSAPDWFTASDHRPVVVRLVPVDRETP